MRTQHRRTRCFIFLGMLALLALACRKQETPPAPFLLDGELPINVAAEAPVGEPLPVTIGPVNAPDGTPILLTATGTFGTWAFRGLLQGGYLTITLPPEFTRHSGLVSLVATSGHAVGEAETRLLAGEPVEPLVPLVGARSIIADAAHWSMTVTLPQDRFDNPVADGTPVEIRALHPGGRLETRVQPVEHLLAWIRLYSGTKAGETRIAVESGEAVGPEGLLLEIPGWPTPFTLEAEPSTQPADDRSLITVRTSTIRDQFGNVVPDGTIVTFVAETPDGPRFIPSVTVNGVAEAPIQAPDEPAIFQIVGSVYGVRSKPLTVAFTPGPAVNRFTVTPHLDEPNGALYLDAGPLLGQLNQYIPDGTPVLYHLTHESGQEEWLSAPAEAGHARAELRLRFLQPGTYTVEVLAGVGRGETTFVVEKAVIERAQQAAREAGEP